MDAYAYAHPDFLIVFAAGNRGVQEDMQVHKSPGAYTIATPGTSKNVLTVGAAMNAREASEAQLPPRLLLQLRAPADGGGEGGGGQLASVEVCASISPSVPRVHHRHTLFRGRLYGGAYPTVRAQRKLWVHLGPLSVGGAHPGGSVPPPATHPRGGG